ncbi:hypothetical protein BKA70DRAFT_1241890 [Coprinopsis sp. MPI-PUGE-AT-0042]|nr:hypothetical protein BKA70DRAFT_1241890 [Coprinopsis sp. MPI-PUGE-AT-0042]
MPTQAIRTVWRDGDLDGYLPVSQIQSSAPEEDTALLFERHEKRAKGFTPSIRAPLQEERRRIEDLLYEPRAQPIGHSSMTGSLMRVWYRGEWEWLREKRTDSKVVCPQDGVLPRVPLVMPRRCLLAQWRGRDWAATELVRDPSMHGWRVNVVVALLTNAARVSLVGQGVVGLGCPGLADKKRAGTIGSESTV